MPSCASGARRMGAGRKRAALARGVQMPCRPALHGRPQARALYPARRRANAADRVHHRNLTPRRTRPRAGSLHSDCGREATSRSTAAPSRRVLRRHCARYWPSGARLNLAYRGSRPQVRAILRRSGKTHARLYADFRAGAGNIRPASPTHELRSDGVAYRIRRSMPIPSWACGVDGYNPGGVVRAAARLGMTATVTYPRNPREAHHVNLRRRRPRRPQSRREGRARSRLPESR